MTVLAAGTVLVGRLRHEPWLAIAASTAGVVVAWAAILWAGELGGDVPLVVVLTAAGIFLMMHGESRARAARDARTSVARSRSPSADRGQ